MYIAPVNNFSNIYFTGKKSPVYAINSEGYIRFNSSKEAAAVLGVSTSCVSRALSNKSLKTGYYYIVEADEIEHKADNGEIVVYRERIDEILKERFQNSAKYKPIYAIDKHGNYLKFDSHIKAAKNLGLIAGSIHDVVLGKNNTCGGYAFVDALEIETKDKNGNTVVDTNKVREIVEDTFYKKPVYAIDKQGNYTRFENQAKAAHAMGMTRQNVNQTIVGKNNTCGGYLFVNAADIEIKDKEGRVFVDEAKIQELIAGPTLPNKRRGPVYAIDKQGNYTRFENQVQAAHALDVSQSYINLAVIGKSTTCKGYFLADADNVETINELGETVINEEKIKALIEKKISDIENTHCGKKPKPVYAIDKDGNYERFESQAQAAHAIGVAQGNINQCILGKLNACKNYIFIDAEEVEFKKEGKAVLDEDKIHELIAQKIPYLQNPIIKRKPKPVYAIDVNGNYKKYASRKEISESLGISLYTVNAVVSGFQKSSCGMIFVNADKIEKTDKNGRIVVDEEIIKKQTEERFPKIMFLA